MNEFKPINISNATRIFITGASSGLGQAIATEYAKRFFESLTLNKTSVSASPMVIGLAGRRNNVLAEFAAQLQNKYQVNCAIYALDVRDSAALNAAAENFIVKLK